MSRDELADLLGIDYSDPVQRLARDLTEADFAMVDALVKARIANGLTQADVAERMGRNVEVVADIEAVGCDPCLSTLRRYALAIGARIEHSVRPADAGEGL